MKRLKLVSVMVCIGLFGCQIDEVTYSLKEEITAGLEFYASIEDDALAKTTLDEHNNVRWSENDQIVIFRESTLGSKYQIKSGFVGKTTGSFSLISSGSSGDDFSAGGELSHNIAYYPYSETVECEKYEADYKLSINLPSEQTYASESFGNNTFPMVAVSETNNITFRNVCGGMKLLLKGTCMVTSITVEGKDGEKLSGQAYVIAYTDDTKPVITMAENASTSATLNCGAGVQLNETDATEFILSLPPTIFTNGFAVTIMDSNGGTQVIETTKTNSILRSSLLVMPELTVQTSQTPQQKDYVDEYGVNHGHGVEIDGTVWAPVNCGYHASDYRYGKLYQWGRKYGQGSNDDIFRRGPVSLSVGQSSDNAGVFYYNEDSPHDWLNEKNDALWNAGTESDPIKTAYDPCPDGWRVPTYSEMNNLIRNKSIWNAGYWFSGSTSYSTNAPRVFFSAGGYIDWEGEKDCQGREGHYWTSTPKGNYARCLAILDVTIDLYLNYDRAYGRSVRCVQDNSEVSETIFKLAEGTPETYSLQFGSNQLIVPIETNVDVDVMINYSDSSTDWITYADILSQSDTQKQLVFEIASNKTASVRTAQIILGNSQLNESIILEIGQVPFTGLDDSSFDVNKYITYVQDYEYEGSGDAFDYDMYYYGTTIYSSGLARSSKVEYKFKLNDFSSGSFYITVDDYDDSIYPLYLNANGLNVDMKCYTWSEMGVKKTDIITLTFEGTTMTVNGKTIENVSSFFRCLSGYIWSGHYHERDDGMWWNDYTFQDGARIYYAKGWDSNGMLTYIGGAALSTNGRACWKSVYYDSSSGDQVTQEHFPRVTSSFGHGNL